MSDQSQERGFAVGDPVLLIDPKDRQYMVNVPEPGEVVKVKAEPLTHEVFAGRLPGETLITPQVHRYLLVRPTLGQIVMNMPRAAQVIFPQDLAMMLFWGDVAPGMKLIEIGCGHGALTMSLLRALGENGRLISYDIRQDHLNRTGKNVARYLGPEAFSRWEPVLVGEEAASFPHGPADRVFSDVPQPWDLAPEVAKALAPGGIWVAFVPTVLQMMHQVEAARSFREFCLDEAFEALMRYWHIKPPSVRPKHSMRGHTGFLVVCRRRWKQDLEERKDKE